MSSSRSEMDSLLSPYFDYLKKANMEQVNDAVVNKTMPFGGRVFFDLKITGGDGLPPQIGRNAIKADNREFFRLYEQKYKEITGHAKVLEIATTAGLLKDGDEKKASAQAAFTQAFTAVNKAGPAAIKHLEDQIKQDPAFGKMWAELIAAKPLPASVDQEKLKAAMVTAIAYHIYATTKETLDRELMKAAGIKKMDVGFDAKVSEIKQANEGLASTSSAPTPSPSPSADAQQNADRKIVRKSTQRNLDASVVSSSGNVDQGPQSSAPSIKADKKSPLLSVSEGAKLARRDSRIIQRPGTPSPSAAPQSQPNPSSKPDPDAPSPPRMGGKH